MSPSRNLSALRWPSRGPMGSRPRSVSRWALAGVLLLLGAAGCGEGEIGNGRPEDGGASARDGAPRSPDGGSPAGDAGPAADGPPADLGPTTQALEVSENEWNPGGAMTGAIAAVAEVDATLVTFGSQGATMLVGGTVVGFDARVTAWRAAAALPAVDGSAGENGHWAVGLDEEGRLHRMRADLRLEDITDRYALEEGEAITGLADLGTGRVALGTASGVAVADATTVTRFDTGALGSLAGGGGRLAGVVSGGIAVLDPQAEELSTFPLEGAQLAALTGEGRLVAATDYAVYAEGEGGGLDLRYQGKAAVTGLVRSGDHVWFVAGGELGLLRGLDLYLTQGLGLPEGARLLGSPGGEVWVLRADDSLVRYGAQISPDQLAWVETVQPVFNRVCSRCHLPGGFAGIDLSTYATWLERREAIHERVVVLEDMPPPGTTLDPAEREAVKIWSERMP